MDFTLPPAIEERRRARQFVEDEVLPVENDSGQLRRHENITLAALRRCAKSQGGGLWAPQMPTERGGMGCRPLAWRRSMRK